jgi:hypothetical protein
VSPSPVRLLAPCPDAHAASAKHAVLLCDTVRPEDLVTTHVLKPTADASSSCDSSAGRGSRTSALTHSEDSGRRSRSSRTCLSKPREGRGLLGKSRVPRRLHCHCGQIHLRLAVCRRGH